MRTKATGKKATRERVGPQQQVNIRVEPALYHALETLARQDRRSLPQTARHLMEEGLRKHMGEGAIAQDISSREIATLAVEGGAFDWLAEEPDVYDDTCGEPL